MNSVGRIWLEHHPYGSAFPMRRAQSVQWFVDGRSFMEHAANMMELAREEISLQAGGYHQKFYERTS
ncbi:hypothetical protein WUBG_18993, partial [Wuchereria bancrofti]